MKTRLSLDRFEGRDRGIAVLYTDDKTEALLPRGLLPRTAEAGDILTLRIDVIVRRGRRRMASSRGGRGWSAVR